MDSCCFHHWNIKFFFKFFFKSKGIIRCSSHNSWLCPGGFESLPALILYGEISAWYRGLLLTNNVTAYSLRGKMVIYNGEWSLYLRQQWKHLESVWTHTFCYQNHHVIISSYERRGRRKNEDNRNTASHCAYCVPHHFGFIRLTFSL